MFCTNIFEVFRIQKDFYQTQSRILLMSCLWKKRKHFAWMRVGFVRRPIMIESFPSFLFSSVLIPLLFFHAPSRQLWVCLPSLFPHFVYHNYRYCCPSFNHSVLVLSITLSFSSCIRFVPRVETNLVLVAHFNFLLLSLILGGSLLLPKYFLRYLRPLRTNKLCRNVP